ncbi:MAG: TetR/AcrR family transcriptional regulator [Acidocella sp.]|uniref:TetR/AcrR family transcriptional regulator n=1 Tax=Acidocella sp. TaxID=50710 RepID=UPI003FD6E07C
MSTAETRIHDAALRIFAERGVTQLTVSELAEEAGIARGTVYNNLGSTDALFEEVAAGLADEMLRRIVSSFAEIDDPAHRLANGIRFFVRRAHEEPVWGRFIVRYTFSNDSLRAIWGGAPAGDLRRGQEQKRYSIDPDQVQSALGMISGSTLSAMMLVVEGHKTWRASGADAAELVLRALGVAPREARTIANLDLPPLPKLS